MSSKLTHVVYLDTNVHIMPTNCHKYLFIELTLFKFVGVFKFKACIYIMKNKDERGKRISVTEKVGWIVNDVPPLPLWLSFHLKYSLLSFVPAQTLWRRQAGLLPWVQCYVPNKATVSEGLIRIDFVSNTLHDFDALFSQRQYQSIDEILSA